MQKQNVSAFTTIEILVVISVIAVLTVGVLTAVQRARVQSRNSEIKKVMSEMEGVQTTIKSERNTFAGYQPGVGFEDQRLQEIHQEIKDINGVGIASARLLKGKSDGWVIFTPTLGITGGKSGSLCYSSESKAPRRYNTYNSSERYALAVQENDWKCPVNRLSDLPGIGDEGLTYDWFDVSVYRDTHSRPTTVSEMDNYFDASLTGIEFKGNGHHDNEVEWHSNQNYNGNNTWNWPIVKPNYITRNQKFSWQARGTLKVPTTGDYTFGIDGDDAVDLKIDGTKIVSWYGSHGTAADPGSSQPDYTAPAFSCCGTNPQKPGDPIGRNTITLTEGYHDIKVRMVDGGGASAIAVGWEGPGDGDADFQVDTIPKSFLYRYEISDP